MISAPNWRVIKTLKKRKFKGSSRKEIGKRSSMKSIYIKKIESSMNSTNISTNCSIGSLLSKKRLPSSPKRLPAAQMANNSKATM